MPEQLFLRYFATL